MSLEPNTDFCKNCGNSLSGTYCSNCGEKVINQTDFSIPALVGKALGTFTNFDSKFFKSFKHLFFKPGSLSLNYIRGIRVPYMAPFQLFLIANIIFFFFLSNDDMFRTPSQYFFRESFDGYQVLNKVRAIAAARQITQEDVANLYDIQSTYLAKSLLLLLTPLLALFFVLLFPKTHKQFGKHLVFATHFLSFILLLTVLLTVPVHQFYTGNNRWMFFSSFLSISCLYVSVAFKTFYANSWFKSILKGILSIGVFIILIFLYKSFINILSLNTI